LVQTDTALAWDSDWALTLKKDYSGLGYGNIDHIYEESERLLVTDR
jgi:hypothetical protein